MEVHNPTNSKQSGINPMPFFCVPNLSLSSLRGMSRRTFDMSHLKFLGVLRAFARDKSGATISIAIPISIAKAVSSVSLMSFAQIYVSFLFRTMVFGRDGARPSSMLRMKNT